LNEQPGRRVPQELHGLRTQCLSIRAKTGRKTARLRLRGTFSV
jgi:hypothetical protein